MSVAPGERLMKMWPRCENIDTLYSIESCCPFGKLRKGAC